MTIVSVWSLNGNHEYFYYCFLIQFKTRQGTANSLFPMCCYFIFLTKQAFFPFLFASQILEAKSKELKEADKSYDVVRQNVDKLNKELGSKMEELENKEKHLREVETRIQLSLRCAGQYEHGRGTCSEFSFLLF